MFSRHESIQYTLDIATGNENEQYLETITMREESLSTMLGRKQGNWILQYHVPTLLNDQSKIIIQMDVRQL